MSRTYVVLTLVSPFVFLISHTKNYRKMKVTLSSTKNHQVYRTKNGKADILLGYSKAEDVPPCFSPMEAVLASLGGCMSIDIMMILEKQRQQVDDYKVEVIGHRVDDVPAVFDQITIHITITGKVKAEKIEQAIRLSEEKYCSVHRMLAPTIDIKTQYTINPGA